jgi:hypothetical protein
MTYQDPMRCPSHQPLRSNWIGSYWLRRFCSGLWDHLCRVIFSRAFLFSTILLCKKRWEEGMKHAQGKTWKHVVARNSQLDFLVTFTTFTSRSYRAGTLATGVACDPAEPTGLQESWNLSLQSDSLFPLLEWLCLLLRSKRSLSSCHVLLRLKGGLQYQMVILGLKLAHNLTTVGWNRKMQYIDIYIYCLRLHLSSGKPVKR